MVFNNIRFYQIHKPLILLALREGGTPVKNAYEGGWVGYFDHSIVI
jgi:hypothetical protein